MLLETFFTFASFSIVGANVPIPQAVEALLKVPFALKFQAVQFRAGYNYALLDYSIRLFRRFDLNYRRAVLLSGHYFPVFPCYIDLFQTLV